MQATKMHCSAALVTAQQSFTDVPALPADVHWASRRSISAEGDSGTEPYVASHNVLRAHAAAVAEFRRLVPGGRISMNLNGDWAEPYTQSDDDKVLRHSHSSTLQQSHGCNQVCLFLGMMLALHPGVRTAK